MWIEYDYVLYEIFSYFVARHSLLLATKKLNQK